MKNSKKNTRKDQILFLASKVFAKKGYHATSISDICEKSGVARGTIYLYFKNKRDIFETLITNFSSSMLENIRMFSLDEPLCDQFDRNIRHFAETIIQNRDLTKIIASEAVGLDNEFDHHLILFYTKLAEYVEGSLVMMQKCKEIPDKINARLLAYSIVGTMKEVAYQWSLDSGNVLEMDSLLNYLKNFKLKSFIQFT
ncbi:MAG: TetR/AcrR family transcriptional regulator [bacterium]